MESHSLLLSIAVLFLMVTVLVTTQPNITGFVPTTTHSQTLDLVSSETKRYSLTPSFGKLHLASFAVSGNVAGSGLVNIYLTDGEQKLLVYTNKRKVKSNLAQITGYVPADLIISPGESLNETDTLPSGYTTQSGTFTSVCIETCVLGQQFLKKDKIFLEVIIEEPATVHITEMAFSTLDE
ncbi:hypothetical protein J4219_06555 [Candidatus Woesearchaeota archaeon]|nr:hypothetical protein [Candidatus Woesearchaeota archaeon]